MIMFEGICSASQLQRQLPVLTFFNSREEKSSFFVAEIKIDSFLLYGDVVKSPEDPIEKRQQHIGFQRQLLLVTSLASKAPYDRSNG